MTIDVFKIRLKNKQLLTSLFATAMKKESTNKESTVSLNQHLLAI